MFVPAVRFAGMLVIYQILRLLFYAFNASLFPNVSLGGWPLMMYGGLRFDISALVYLNLLYFVLHYLSFRAKFGRVMGRVIDGVFIVFNSVGVAGDCIDFIYYRFILRRTTFGVLDILKNEQNMGSLCLHFAVCRSHCRFGPPHPAWPLATARQGAICEREHNGVCHCLWSFRRRHSRWRAAQHAPHCHEQRSRLRL